MVNVSASSVVDRVVETRWVNPKLWNWYLLLLC